MLTSVALAVVFVFCVLLFLLLLLIATAWKQSERDCEHWIQAHKTVTNGKERVAAELEKMKQRVEEQRKIAQELQDKLERIHSVFYPPVGSEDIESKD
jgi:predicted PurR-regulated permease PerM